MNILFFLTPKAICAHLRAEDSVRQALERMDKTGYASLPILSRDGRYRGTLTEGDLLRAIKNLDTADKRSMEKLCIMDIPRRKNYEPVSVDTKVEDLMSKAVEQNFVPVVDDRDAFIGIVTRKAIMQYCLDHYINGREKPKKQEPVVTSWTYRI